MKKTVKETVRQILKEKGEITNHWCIDTRLTTRLGAVIKVLRNEGMDIVSEGYLPGTKNFRYTYKAKPKPKVEFVNVGGVMHAKVISGRASEVSNVMINGQSV